MSDTAAPSSLSPIACAQIAQLYREHFLAVRHYLTRRLGCSEIGYDAAQDVFLRLLLSPGKLAHPNPRGFLLRVARNLAIDRQRAQAREPQPETLDGLENELDDPIADPARIADARQRLRQLAGCIAELPPRCREVFVLQRFEGASQQEIAARLGISVKMVEAHLARAMLQLYRACTR